MTALRARLRSVALVACVALLVPVGATSQADATHRGTASKPAGGPRKTWPTKFNARGTTNCSAGTSELTSQCEFRVIRRPGGKAEIWLAKPAVRDALRVLYFDNGKFTTNDTAKISTSRKSDDWFVRVDSTEQYRIPDAMIFGG